jgi:ABC-2 type transport system permease protein
MGNPLLWALSTSSWLLGGVLYPTEVLPVPLRVIARAVPLTHALEGLRAALLEGAGVREVLPSCIALAAVAAVALPIGLFLVMAGVRRIRARGSFARG